MRGADCGDPYRAGKKFQVSDVVTVGKEYCMRAPTDTYPIITARITGLKLRVHSSMIVETWQSKAYTTYCIAQKISSKTVDTQDEMFKTLVTKL